MGEDREAFENVGEGERLETGEMSALEFDGLEEGFGDRWRAGVVVAGHVADFGFDSGVVLVVLEDEADGECDGTLPPVELYSENGVLDGLGLEVGFDFAPEFDACGAGEVERGGLRASFGEVHAVEMPPFVGRCGERHGAGEIIDHVGGDGPLDGARGGLLGVYGVDGDAEDHGEEKNDFFHA